MGFRSVEMKRSEFFGSQSGAEGAPQSEPPKPGDTQAPAGVEHATPPAASDDEAPADSVSAAPVAEPPPVGVPAGEGLDDLADGAEGVETAPEDPVAVAEAVDTLTEAADSATEGADTVPLEMAPATVLSDPLDGGSAGEAIEQAAAPQTSGASCELETSADVIIVWRPDHRKTSHRRERESRQSRSEGPGRSDVRVHSPAAAPSWRRESAAPPPKRPNHPNSSRSDEKRRQRPHDYDMARSAPTAPPQQPAKVDPNSPFAKLLELRSLLEEQANKRQ
jgi:ATP-dependent RNA helicase SUPV3L1/SUV3